MSPFALSLIWGSVAGASTVAGIILVRFAEKAARRHSLLLVGFATGALLAIAFFHLIPEAAKLSPNGLAWVLAGFVAFYVIENFIAVHAFHEYKQDDRHVVGIMSSVGLLFHSLIDGVLIGVGFEVDPSLGVMATLGVILHEVPEGMITMAILTDSGATRRNAIQVSLAVALATPLGAMLASAFLKGVSKGAVGVALGLAAGSFLYIAAADLVPETHKRRSPGVLAAFLLGIAVMYSIGRIMG